jgi:hypothetical protein
MLGRSTLRAAADSGLGTAAFIIDGADAQFDGIEFVGGDTVFDVKDGGLTLNNAGFRANRRGIKATNSNLQITDTDFS